MVGEIECAGEREFEPPLQQVRQLRTRLYTCGERGQEQVPQCAEAANWPCQEDEDQQPHDTPAHVFTRHHRGGMSEAGGSFVSEAGGAFVAGWATLSVVSWRGGRDWWWGCGVLQCQFLNCLLVHSRVDLEI